MPALLQQIKQALAEGKCCIVGLQSTGEAHANEAVDDDDGGAGPTEAIPGEPRPLDPPSPKVGVDSCVPNTEADSDDVVSEVEVTATGAAGAVVGLPADHPDDAPPQLADQAGSVKVSFP